MNQDQIEDALAGVEEKWDDKDEKLEKGKRGSLSSLVDSKSSGSFGAAESTGGKLSGTASASVGKPGFFKRMSSLHPLALVGIGAGVVGVITAAVLLLRRRKA